MNDEKILELAAENESHLYSERVWVFDEEALIAFARAVIEAERESSDKPVAWVSCDGYLSHYRLGDEYIPLYRRQQPKARMADKDIKTLWTENLITVSEEQGYIRFARAIERRISGEKEARLAEDDEEPFLWVETDKNGELNWDVTCMFSDSPAFIERPLPLYRRPLPMARLTDEEINDCFDIAQRSFHKHQSGIKGQQLNIQD